MPARALLDGEDVVVAGADGEVALLSAELVLPVDVAVSRRVVAHPHGDGVADQVDAEGGESERLVRLRHRVDRRQTAGEVVVADGAAAAQRSADDLAVELRVALQLDVGERRRRRPPSRRSSR
jgi:hypothetical protein